MFSLLTTIITSDKSMKKKILTLGFSTLLISPFSYADSDFQVFSTFDSEVYTEAQPVKAFIDDFDAPLTSGDSAFTYNVFELGVGYGNFKVGYQSRFDYVLSFDPDTANYLHTEKNDLPFEERDYVYYLDGKQSTTNGLFVSYDFKFLESDALTITPKLTVFASTHFQDANVEGTVYSDEIQGALEVDYYFSKDVLFKRFTPDENPSGVGYSFDLAADWKVNQDLTLGFLAQDLFYETEYEESGFVNGYTTEVPFTETSDGGIATEPTIRLATSELGHEKAHTFEMPVRIKAYVDYRINSQFSSEIMIKRYDQDTFSQLKGRFHFWDHWALIGGYETNSESFLLGVENEYFGLNVQTDNLNIDKAYYANLNWYMKLAF